MKDNLDTNYVEWGRLVTEWRRGPEKASDSEEPVHHEPQRRQHINKGPDVSEGVFTSEEDEVGGHGGLLRKPPTSLNPRKI